MDKRLKLTVEQKELAEKFNDLCLEMNKKGIGFIASDYNIFLLNTNDVEKTIEPDEMVLDDEDENDEELVDITELYCSKLKSFYSGMFFDDYFGIRQRKLKKHREKKLGTWL